MEVREFGHHPAVTCRRDMPLGKVAELMRSNNVGSVVVMDEHGRMAGIATDRDIVLRGLGEGLDADWYGPSARRSRTPRCQPEQTSRPAPARCVGRRGPRW